VIEFVCGGFDLGWEAAAGTDRVQTETRGTALKRSQRIGL
jgi:hypothetical protein